jgi:hypothetical protein
MSRAPRGRYTSFSGVSNWQSFGTRERAITQAVWMNKVPSTATSVHHLVVNFHWTQVREREREDRESTYRHISRGDDQCG